MTKKSFVADFVEVGFAFFFEVFLDCLKKYVEIRVYDAAIV